MPFGVPEIDGRLPQGELALGALHEIAGGGNGAVDGAATALLAAAVAARTKGPVLWCMTRADLFAPALAQVGLSPGRVIYVEAGDEKALLSCMEEGLRHGGLGAVVGELARLSMTALRRLQLSAENSGTIGIAIRRWRLQTEASDFGQPTASATRGGTFVFVERLWRSTKYRQVYLHAYKSVSEACVGIGRYLKLG